MAHNCGIHPENRAKTGVDAINAQNQAMKISVRGYSETKFENPMGFEKALEGQLQEDQMKFIARDSKEAGGFLKKIPWRDINFLPETWSHTAAATNIIDGGVPGLHPELCSENGMADRNKQAMPLQGRMPCVGFPRELEVACPELPSQVRQLHEVHSKET